MDKSEVCLAADKKPEPRKPSSASAGSKKRRYKADMKCNSTFLDMVLEVITDPYDKTNADVVDRCLRLNGELMPVPQTEAEDALMDKVLWDYMSKKTANNLSVVINSPDVVTIMVAGNTRINNQEFSTFSREQTYSANGLLELVHPMKGQPLNPYKQGEIVMKQMGTFYNYPQLCLRGWNSRKKPIMGQFYHQRTQSLFTNQPCTMKLNDDFICLFTKEPTFRIRGLCKNAVMDTQYKLAEHKPGKVKSKKQDTRGYVGPKGWVISRNKTDKRWRMTHYHYTHLTLTMLDQDSLPLGRPKWMVDNNACQEGQTSTEILQMSGCEEDQFTCDDGKCLQISQRCNNIEVMNTGCLYQVPQFSLT